MSRNKGFTLIELMVVIVIMGVLAALAIPKFTNASAKAKMSEAPPVLAAYESAQLASVAETGKIGALGDLVFDAPDSTNWWGWDGTTDGEYKATALVAMGKFAASSYLKTVVDSASAISHFSNDSLNANKFLPNFKAKNE